MIWLVAPALAQTNACFPPSLGSALPLDWSGGVPPEVVITVAAEASRTPFCADERFVTLEGPEPVEADLEIDGAVLRVRPRAPLAPGLWTLEVTSELLRFTVEDPPGELVPPPLPEASLAVERDCGGAFPVTSVSLDATFPSPPPEGVAMLEGVVTADDVEEVIGATPYRGATVGAHFEHVYDHDPEICARVRAIGWYGEVAWETPEQCSPEPRCPWEDDLDGAAEPRCGCSSGPTGVLALLTLPAWRARRRGASRASRPPAPRA